VPLWSHVERENYVFERMKYHTEVEKLQDDDIPECAPKERFKDDDTFAVYSETNKTRAYRVLPTEEQANVFCADLNKEGKKKYHVVQRIGFDKKCANYCKVNTFCHYWKKLNA
jgi:hypothetical protein